MSTELPKGCYKYIDHKRIICKDIGCDRPHDQRDISVEHAIRHDFVIRKRGGFFRKRYWAVLSTTTYEMSGNYRGTYMGGRSWAETDLTGLEWRFRTERDAERFAYKEVYHDDTIGKELSSTLRF